MTHMCKPLVEAETAPLNSHPPSRTAGPHRSTVRVCCFPDELIASTGSSTHCRARDPWRFPDVSIADELPHADAGTHHVVRRPQLPAERGRTRVIPVDRRDCAGLDVKREHPLMPGRGPEQLNRLHRVRGQTLEVHEDMTGTTAEQVSPPNGRKLSPVHTTDQHGVLMQLTENPHPGHLLWPETGERPWPHAAM